MRFHIFSKDNALAKNRHIDHSFRECLLYDAETRNECRDSLMREAYAAAMSTARWAWPDDKKDGTHIYDMLMQAVRIDLFGSSLTRLMCTAQDEISYAQFALPKFPFPKTYEPTKIMNMPFGDNTVVSTPYDAKKWKTALRDLSANDFDQQHSTLNHYSGNYYPDLKLIVIENGRHHAAAATLKQQGSADVTVWDLAQCYPYLYTDGAYWQDTSSGAERKRYRERRVSDVRLAILYGMAQYRWEMKSSY